MKVLKQATKKGATVLTVEMEPGEKLLAVRESAFYKLGYPLNDVVTGNIIADAGLVSWCSIEQKWVG